MQHFTLDGAYLGEWDNLGAPNDVCLDAEQTVYIAEGGPAITSRGPIRTTRGPGVTIMSLDGEILAQWGERGDAPGQFAASPHSLWVDSPRGYLRRRGHDPRPAAKIHSGAMRGSHPMVLLLRAGDVDSGFHRNDEIGPEE